MSQCSATKTPTPSVFHAFDLEVMITFLLRINKNMSSEINAITTLNQTKTKASATIHFPRIAVKPQMKIIMCNMNWYFNFSHIKKSRSFLTGINVFLKFISSIQKVGKSLTSKVKDNYFLYFFLADFNFFSSFASCSSSLVLFVLSLACSSFAFETSILPFSIFLSSLSWSFFKLSLLLSIFSCDFLMLSSSFLYFSSAFWAFSASFWAFSASFAFFSASFFAFSSSFASFFALSASLSASLFWLFASASFFFWSSFFFSASSVAFFSTFF